MDFDLKLRYSLLSHWGCPAPRVAVSSRDELIPIIYPRMVLVEEWRYVVYEVSLETRAGRQAFKSNQLGRKRSGITRHARMIHAFNCVTDT